jgi:hypothetical protein
MVEWGHSLPYPNKDIIEIDECGWENIRCKVSKLDTIILKNTVEKARKFKLNFDHEVRVEDDVLYILLLRRPRQKGCSLDMSKEWQQKASTIVSFFLLTRFS